MVMIKSRYINKCTLLLILFITNTIAMDVPADIWNSIIARSRTPEKNALRKCSKQLYALSSKNNIALYTQSRLFLSVSQKEYALLLCTYKNNVSAVKRLLRYGAYCHYVRCGIALDPLDIALSNNNQELVDLFKDEFGEFSAQEEWGFKVLPYPMAAFFGDKQLLEKYIASEEYDPVYENGNEKWKGSTLLYPALLNGHTDIALLLLTHPKTIEHINSGLKGSGRPIDIALSKGNSCIVKKLLAIPSLDISPKALYVRFNRCAMRGYLDCMKLLVEYRSFSINEESKEAISNGKYSLSSWSYTTPLVKAIFSGHAHIVAYLLGLKNIDVNKDTYTNPGYDKDNAGDPLYTAALLGDVTITSLLLAHPKINSCRFNLYSGYTALHVACKNGHVQVAQLLINHSPKLLSLKTQKTQESAYQIAYHYKQYEMVKFLLSLYKC